MDEEARTKIVEAVGVASASGVKGVSSREVEAAMAAAVQHAYDEGITDPEVIRQRQLEARRNLIPKATPPE